MDTSVGADASLEAPVIAGAAAADATYAAPELCSVRRPGEPQTSAVEFLSSEVFGSPKEPEWAAPNFHLRLSLPRIIMDMLDVPSNSKEAVITAMRAMSKAHEAGVEYDQLGEIKAQR